MQRAIEYRTNRGTRLVLEANGRVLPGTGLVDLRAMGCPEHIVRKVERAQETCAARVTAAKTTSDLKARAAQIGAQIAADKVKFADVLNPPATPAPKVSSFVDEAMQKRLRAASGKIHG